MGILEDLGDQMLDPMRQMVGDALNVTQEMARRYGAALEALDGRYPGSVTFSTNGHSPVVLSQPPPLALPAVPEPEPEPEVVITLARPDIPLSSSADYCLAVLEAAWEARYIGSAGIPGALRAGEVLAVMIEWGWRHRLHMYAQQTVSSALGALLPGGRVVRPERGVYVLAVAVEKKKPDRKTPILNLVSTREMILSVMRGMSNQVVSARVVLEKMLAAGWKTTSNNPLAIINTTLSQLIRTNDNLTRPEPGLYCYRQG